MYYPTPMTGDFCPHLLITTLPKHPNFQVLPVTCMCGTILLLVGRSLYEPEGRSIFLTSSRGNRDRGNQQKGASIDGDSKFRCVNTAEPANESALSPVLPSLPPPPYPRCRVAVYPSAKISVVSPTTEPPPPPRGWMRSCSREPRDVRLLRSNLVYSRHAVLGATIVVSSTGLRTVSTQCPPLLSA